MNRCKTYPYLEVIRDIVIFASWGTQQSVVAMCFSLIRWWCLSIAGLLKGVALWRWLILGICCHVCALRGCLWLVWVDIVDSLGCVKEDDGAGGAKSTGTPPNGTRVFWDAI